ncbi:MAG: hypothetical protein PWQ72_1092 [Pseudothermotoga sp.]|nr:hypothetical protein [Pseudothermotoga sp.]
MIVYTSRENAAKFPEQSGFKITLEKYLLRRKKLYMSKSTVSIMNTERGNLAFA